VVRAGVKGSLIMMNMTLVTGLVREGRDVDVALGRILALGYSKDDVSVIMSDDAGRRHFATEPSDPSTVATGAALGIAAGGAVGAILAAILVVGTSFVLPGVGLLVAGPLAATLLGLGVGGATGGAAGTLLAAGIPEHRARVYETGLAKGLVVLGVHAHAPNDTLAIEQIFRDADVARVQVVSVEPPAIVAAH
jgi:hypothetical protein